MNPIPDLSIARLHSLYKSGAATPAQVISEIYDRIEAQPLNPIWISLVPREQVLARATSLNSELPLLGIPFAVKDNIDVAGIPTTAGCPAYAFTPQSDAFAVNRLQRAGAILIGKTNLDQFATGLVGTRSPYGACSCVFDSRYISGGSSSGSAVAVASGLVTFSLGTDTAGSGRVPAAFNNIFGLKPSRGLLSATGVLPACRSLDCVSIFALSANDAREVFDAAIANDPEDPFSRTYPPDAAWLPRQLRIGTPRAEQLEFFGDQEYKRLYQRALNLLVEQGHTLVEIDFDPFRAVAELLYAGPYVAERFAAVGDFVKNHLGDVNSVVASIVTAAERWTAADAYRALYKLEALRKETDAAWSRMDVLILPTTATTYTIEQVHADPMKLNSRLGYYTNFANLLDLCGVAVPAGFTKAGLPFGVTVFSRAFLDKELLAFAQGMQKQSPRSVLLGVVGAHLSGQPLNYQLLDRGARLVKTTKTAATYRMFALTNTTPPKPGLLKVPGFAGPGVEIEVWAMGEAEFGSFVDAVPPPLSIGTCELSDGTSVKGFICEPYATEGMPEITSLGGWRPFLSS